MIQPLVYFLIAVLLICGGTALALYLCRVFGMSDPPYGGIRIGAWCLAGILILLAVLRFLVPIFP